MRIVLETTDLLEILGLHLGRTLTPEQVSVRTEPHFEIEIEGAVAVQDIGAKPTATASKTGVATVRAGADYAPRRDSVVEENDGMSMKELLAYSREIEGGIQSIGRR